jgi:HEAT repeat protein
MPQRPEDQINTRIFLPEEELEGAEADVEIEIDLDAEASGSSPQAAAHASFDDALEAIEQGSIELGTLTGLSDLSREQVQQLADIWNELPAEARAPIAEHAFVLGDDDLMLDFMRFFEFAVNDESIAVRQYAARGLAAYDDPDLVPALIRLATTDVSDDVRVAAIESLGSFADMEEFGMLDEETGAEVRRTLAGILSDDAAPGRLRASALEAVAVISGHRAILDAIQGFFDSGDAELRIGSIRAMARSVNPRWQPLLEATLRSADPDERQEAVSALGAYEDEALVPLLTRVAREDREISVRLEAIQTLGLIGGRTALRELETLRGHASDDEIEAIDEAIMDAAQNIDQDEEIDDEDDSLDAELRRLDM